MNRIEIWFEGDMDPEDWEDLIGKITYLMKYGDGVARFAGTYAGPTGLGTINGC